jgi:hypothetical protein
VPASIEDVIHTRRRLLKPERLAKDVADVGRKAAGGTKGFDAPGRGLGCLQRQKAQESRKAGPPSRPK